MHILYFGCLATNLLDFLKTHYFALLCKFMCSWLLLGYMNKTLFTQIAFDYLILTFKVKSSAKNTRYFSETWFLSFVSMVTAGVSGALHFPIGYRQIAWAYTSITRKVNYIS